MSNLCLCLIGLALGSPALRAAAPMPSANPDPKEPVQLRSGLHLPEIQVHDPWILAEKSSHTYYLYTSASAPMTGQNRGGTFMYKSPDLLTWEGPYTVFVCPDGSWADPPQRAWAPEVHAYKGKYYLFTTLTIRIAPYRSKTSTRRVRTSCAAPSSRSPTCRPARSGC
jgi:beta-xylosidase